VQDLGYIIFLCLSLFTTPLAVAEDDGENMDTMIMEFDDDDPIAAIMQLMETETKIATKTKMNADYVPGMVTVLQGREMEALGVTSVYEALQFVPGTNWDSEVLGNGKVRVRGVLAGAKTKFLIDGLPVHNTLNADGNGYIISILNVERIEVIRGPGSAVYGGNAYSSVINVVMRENSNRVVVATNTPNQHAANISLSNRYKDYQFDLHYYTT